MCMHVHACVCVCFVYIALRLCTPAKPPVPEPHLWSPGRWLIWKYNHTGQGPIPPPSPISWHIYLKPCIYLQCAVLSLSCLQRWALRSAQFGPVLSNRAHFLLMPELRFTLTFYHGWLTYLKGQLTCRETIEAGVTDIQLWARWRIDNEVYHLCERPHVGVCVRVCVCRTHGFTWLSSWSYRSFCTLKWSTSFRNLASSLYYSAQAHHASVIVQAETMEKSLFMQRYSRLVSLESFDQHESLHNTSPNFA